MRCLFLLLRQPITDDDTDRIATCLRVLAEKTGLMYEIFNKSCRGSLSVMLAAMLADEKEFQKVGLCMSACFSISACFDVVPECQVSMFFPCLIFSHASV